MRGEAAGVRLPRTRCLPSELVSGHKLITGNKLVSGDKLIPRNKLISGYKLISRDGVSVEQLLFTALIPRRRVDVSRRCY